MNLIGINGFKRAGKGATANAIRSLSHTEANVLHVGFADKLKILAARSLGYTDLSDEECIALMDEFKERGSVVSQMWYSGLMEEGTKLGDPSTVKPITGRQYLQHIGNEGRKLFGDTFWIDMVLPHPAPVSDGWVEQAGQAELVLRYPDVDILCITDLRYPNEAERVKSLGGRVWEVVRPGLESDGHDSEQPLPRELVDLTISNDGNLADLEAEVEAALETFA